MGEYSLKIIDRFFRFLAIGVVLGLVALLSNLEVKDLDLWLHLASGKYILEHHTIPAVDFLSFTVAGQPWINHEWLFQVIIALVYQFFGTEGWIAFQGIIFGLIFILLTLLCYGRENKWMLAGLLYLALRAFEIRIILRPDTLSLLFYLVYLTVVFKFLEKRSAPWFLFILQVLWTNIHGFFILGPMTFFIITGSEWARRHINISWIRQLPAYFSDEEYSQLKRILLLVTAACFINPYFVDGVLYPIKILLFAKHQDIFFKSISELQKPVNWNNIFTVNMFLWYKLLILISGLSFFFNRKRMNLSVFILWLLVLAFSLNALRNILFFSVTAVFVTSYNLSQILPRQLIYGYWFETRRWFIVSILAHLLILNQLQHYSDKLVLRGYFNFDTFERKSEYGGVSLRNYPYRAADFLIKQHIKGNFLNDFNSGAYLLGRTFPDIKVFIDGRTEVYGVDFFKQYDAILHGDSKAFEEAVKQYNITGIFLNSVFSPLSKEYMHYIYNNPDWKIIYFDYDAMIFLKDSPENKKWIDRLSFSLEDREVPPADLIKFGVHPIEPYQYYRRAQILYNLEIYDRAREELAQSLRISPGEGETYLLLSKVYSAEKKYDLSFEFARKAKVLNSNNMEARYYIAKAAFNLGNNDLAKAQCERILSLRAMQPQPLFLLSQIFFKEGNEEKGLDTFQKALSADNKGKNSTDAGDVVRFLIREQRLDIAKKVYEIMLEKESKESQYQKQIDVLKDQMIGL